jgi:endonuclease/exonuclease/phosphatase family metal-dependent hydrolase
MRKGVFFWVVFTLNVFATIVLAMAIIAPFVSPNSFWPIAFMGLAFPILVIFNFLFVVFWSIALDKRFWLSFVVLLLSLVHIGKFFRIGPNESTTNGGHSINILSFNTHYMGAFDRKDQDTSFFIDKLKEIKPDIMCLQEFANLGGSFEKPMFRQFFKEYQHFKTVNADGLSQTYPTGYGVCIVSKYPILKSGYLEQTNQSANITVFADIDVDGKIIRVVNTHLKSIVFEKQDYKTVEHISKAEGSAYGWSSIKRIISKLKNAFILRCNQVEIIRQKLDETTYPIILCGDFNDSPTSYAYQTIKGNLLDAFVESGVGTSTTYIGNMPSFRIDYILHDPSFTSRNYQTHSLNFSDHKIVSCTVSF